MNAETLKTELVYKITEFVKQNRIFDLNKLNISERVNFEEMLLSEIKNHFYNINKVPESNHAELLTLSHLHLTKSVLDDLWLITDGEKLQNELDNLEIYKKSEYGWFIFINNVEIASLPKCLADIIIYARKNGYQWISIDNRANTLLEIETYDTDIR